MKILVGSKAAKIHIPTFREGNDVDYWSIEKLWNCDSSVIPQKIFVLFEHDSLVNRCATLNDLLTIKLSHLPYDIQWKKHLNDYLVFKKHRAQINQALYVALQQHWENVVPLLLKDSISRGLFTKRLEQYLSQWDSIEVIADWPRDLELFYSSLLVGNGWMISIPKQLSTKLVRGLDTQSLLPHNAIEDARALKTAYLAV